MLSTHKLRTTCAILVLSLGVILPAQSRDAPTEMEQQAQLYRWVDAHGRLHLSDEPPQDQLYDAVQQEMPELPLSGVRLADEIEATLDTEDKAAKAPKAKNDSRCRRYHSDVNKIELYLEHAPNDRDRQRVADLQEQIALECHGYALKRDYGDSRCRRHHSKLNKLEIYLRHTPNDRDQQRIDDLRRQIELEC